jgi:hypothetical protein
MKREPATCEPATTIILGLGGSAAVSATTGVTPTTVLRWRIRSEKGGTGGFIPRKYHDQIRRMAAEKGATLPVAAFFDLEIAAAVFPREAA